MSQKEQTEEFLEHYGVKGMKWGVRKLAERDASIRTARSSVNASIRDYKIAKKQVRKTTARGSAERAQGKATVAKLKIAYLNNPDRIAAQRLTTGELAVTAMFGSPVASAVANKVVRDTVRSRQETGYYDAKYLK